MSYAYIIDMISKYDMSNYIPDNIVTLLQKSPRVFNKEEVAIIVISGENYDYLTNMDLLSFSKENPHVLIKNECENTKNKVFGKTYFELFSLKLKNDGKHLNAFLEFSKQTPLWSEIIKTKGVLDTLFSLPLWNEIKHHFKNEDMDVLKENSDGTAFWNYIRKMETQLYYPYATYNKSERLETYENVKNQLFKKEEFIKPHNTINHIIKEFIRGKSFPRTLSFSFFEDVLKTEKGIFDNRGLELPNSLVDNLDYSLLFSKMLQPYHMSKTSKMSNKKYQEELENTNAYIKAHIHLNGLNLIREILKEKEDSLSPEFKENMTQFILKTYLDWEKEKISLDLTKDDYLKKKNRL